MKEATNMIRRTFRYRAYPNRETRIAAVSLMKACARIWNNALAERYRNFDAIMVAKQTGMEPPRRVSAYDQYRLIRKKDHPEYAHFHSKAMESVLASVDASFKSFYAMAKKGREDARPPNQMRWCGSVRFRSSGWRLEGNDLWLTGLGRFKLRLHRPVLGKVKTVTIREKNGKWYACFSCEITDYPGACHPLPSPKSPTDVDLRQERAASGGTTGQTRCAGNRRRHSSRSSGGGTTGQTRCAGNSDELLKVGFVGGTTGQTRCAGNQAEANKIPCVGGTTGQTRCAGNVSDMLTPFAYGGTTGQTRCAGNRSSPDALNRSGGTTGQTRCAGNRCEAFGCASAGGTTGQTRCAGNGVAVRVFQLVGGTTGQTRCAGNTPLPGSELSSGGTTGQTRCAGNVGAHATARDSGGTTGQTRCAGNGSSRQMNTRSGGTTGQTRCAGNGNPAGFEPGNVTIYLDEGCLFLRDTEGRCIEPPAFYERSAESLQRAGKRVSSKEKGSRNRRKARATLAKWHEHVANQRSYWLWGLARAYAESHRRITLVTRPSKEPIQYAMNEWTAQRLADAAYAEFEHRLRCKCEEFGTELTVKERITWQREREHLHEVAQLEQTYRTWLEARREVSRFNRGLPRRSRRAREQAATSPI